MKSRHVPQPEARLRILHGDGFKDPITVQEPPVQARDAIRRLAIDQDTRHVS
jgi:hypothetical protein